MCVWNVLSIGYNLYVTYAAETDQAAVYYC